ncbi:conserved hypothetical protein [Denitrovibrio acetiphilus DSM 12809]|uniref:DUF3124 domain-containing protein n=1 Tax=Denitrovibrio acetiphilus (strain DSM 12809 / NBRC 114555 / N2460) TaxID=522772 RepID=D4H8Q2_DENA2|nr:DUF3124 domain-containing protein [Denitrovibrio acetiphilus]ADD68401.1 conserved hypothetical protein [Denitrovibrio acetiphilus DSM 12809]
MKKISFTVIIALLLVQFAFAQVSKHKKQTVYVPAYSHIYVGPKVSPFELSVTLSIRNTNAAEPISVSVADYYNSDGKLIKQFIDKTIILKPFATVSYKVSEYDKTGGSGANFLVKWHADKEVHPPVIESVMIGTRSSQGISFTSRGVVIED